MRCSVTSVLLLVAACSLSLVAADYYDLAEDDLTYGYPSVRRVIGMYNFDESPSLFGQSKVQPFIQLDLKFSTYKWSKQPATDSAAPAASTSAPTDGSGSSSEAASAPSDENTTPPTDVTGINDAQSIRVRFRTMGLKPEGEKEPEVATAVVDEAAAALKQNANENSNVPSVTSSETVTPADIEKQKEEAKEGGAPVVHDTPVHKNAIVQVLIMQDTTLDSIGYWAPDNSLVSYCCTQELLEKQVDGCTAVGTLIVRGGTVHKTMTAEFDDDNKQAHLQGKDAYYDVKTTGEHILIVSNCDPKLSTSETRISGGGIWKNPFGYLPGRLYGFLPFYLAMFLLYVAVTCTWGIMLCIHKNEVAGIQYFISVALGLTLIEVLAWFVDYYNFNSAGVRHMGGVIAAILMTVLRLTVSRMLVVSVAIGYPVVRPQLGFSSKLKIGILGVVYFLCEAALEVVTRYAQTNETAEKWRIFLSLPVAVLNAIFYWWIFTALHDLINYLEQQNQAIKLAMYKTFTHVLAGSLVAAVVFALYQIYFMATNQLALHWSLLWLLDGGFQLILYSLIFVCMAWLWRPSSDSRRYAYAELNMGGGGTALGAMDDDEEFGEVEMGDSHPAMSADNAKFTVEDDDQN